MSRRYRRHHRPPRRRRSLLGRLFTNRYNPGSQLISIGDIIGNVRDIFTCWVNRIPPGSRLQHDRNGKIRGWSSPWRGPW